MESARVTVNGHETNSRRMVVNHVRGLKTALLLTYEVVVHLTTATVASNATLRRTNCCPVNMERMVLFSKTPSTIR